MKPADVREQPSALAVANLAPVLTWLRRVPPEIVLLGIVVLAILALGASLPGMLLSGVSADAPSLATTHTNATGTADDPVDARSGVGLEDWAELAAAEESADVEALKAVMSSTPPRGTLESIPFAFDPSLGEAFAALARADAFGPITMAPLARGWLMASGAGSSDAGSGKGAGRIATVEVVADAGSPQAADGSSLVAGAARAGAQTAGWARGRAAKATEHRRTHGPVLAFAFPDRDRLRAWAQAARRGASERIVGREAEPKPRNPEADVRARIARYLARRYRVPQARVERVVGHAFAAGRELGVDPKLVLAIVSVESSFNPRARSAKGAEGLMQVHTRVHSEKFEPFGGRAAAYDVHANIRVGTRILRDYIRRDGSVRAALKSYVGAALLPHDSGYGRKVLHERARIVAAARGLPEPKGADLREAIHAWGAGAGRLRQVSNDTRVTAPIKPPPRKPQRPALAPVVKQPAPVHQLDAVAPPVTVPRKAAEVSLLGPEAGGTPVPAAAGVNGDRPRL